MNNNSVETPGGSFAPSDETSQILLRPISSCTQDGQILSQQEVVSPDDTDRTSADQQPPINKQRHNLCQDSGLSEGLLIREVKGSSDSNEDKSLAQENIFITWIMEIVTLLFAAGLLVAICILLATYNKQTQPDWGNSGITLNALIATLAMIFRASLAFISFEILSQLRWDWIAVQFRPAKDFQRFDAASRGIWACLRLLPLAIMHQPRAFLAILVTVSSLGVGPFMQQSIQTYQCRRKSAQDGHTASITTANAVNFTDLGVIFRSAQVAPNSELRTAMQDAIVNPSHDSNIGALFTCQSGNCSFPEFSDNTKNSEELITHASIGMCNRCIDVYDFVQDPVPLNASSKYQNFPVFNLPVYYGDGNELDFDEGPMRIVLGRAPSSSFTYMHMRGVGNLTWTRTVASSEFINRARWSTYNFTLLAASRNHCDVATNGTVACPHPCSNDNASCPWAFSGPSDYIAVACTVYPCLKHYHATVEAGKLVEKVVRDIPLRPQSPEPLWSAISITSKLKDLKAVQEPCWVNGTLYTSSNMSFSESLGENATETVQSHIDDWMNESIDDQAHYINITAPRQCVGTIDSDTIRIFQINPFNNVTCLYDMRMESLQCNGTQNQVIDQSSLEVVMRGANTTVETLQENIDSLTMRLTTEIRKRGIGTYASQKAFVNGDEWVAKVCVSIVWEWLALPAVTFALCAMLLLWTIIKDAIFKNDTIWKSSSIPLILKDYPGLERMGLKRMDQIVGRFELKLEKHKMA